MHLKPFTLVCAVATICTTSAASAAFLDTFQTYPISSLPTNTGVVANSGGVWQYWGLGSNGNDATVVTDPANSSNQVLNLSTNLVGTSPDVVTTFPSIIAPGMTGKLVYDVYMSAANLDSLPEVNLGPIGEATGDYSHTLVTLLNDNGGHPGEIQAGIGFGPYTSLGNYSTDAWHQVEADLTNPGGLNGALNFSFKVDGLPTGVTVSTTLTAAGLTTIEAGNNGTANNPASFVYVDNILAVPTPEPASLALALVAFAGLCGYGWHRRRNI